MNVRSIALHQLAQTGLISRTWARGSPKAQPGQRTTPAVTYIICTNPRSGSWMLSEGLASTSVAGNPREWFNILEEQQHRARWRMSHSTDLSYSVYLDILRSKSTSRNGISGIKLHYYQFADLPRRMEGSQGFAGLTASQIIAKLFPHAKYIWLKRSDKARQAISFLIASRTNEWWSVEGAARGASNSAVKDLEFDPQAIARRELALIANDEKWRTYFTENKINPLVIHYEDLVADFTGNVTSVLVWLGVPRAEAVHIRPTRLRRQSNARSEEWLARYEAFKSGHEHLHGPGSNEAEGLLSEFIQQTLNIIPNAWKQWIAHSKLVKTTDDAIVEILTKNGYSQDAALAEVGAAASNPYFRGVARAQQRLNKAVSLLNMQGDLGRLNSQANSVEKRSGLSLDEFRDRYYSANRPVVIQDLMTGWGAMTKWTADHLKRVAGQATVEVITSRNADPQSGPNGRGQRTELRFADFVDMVHTGKVTNGYSIVGDNAFFQRPEAQPLLQDLSPLPGYLDPAILNRHCFLWFGPSGTVTRLHHGLRNTLMAQVAGRKRYRLVPASQWQYVYNDGGAVSEVDCEKPDFVRYPKFRNATVIDVTVNPGETIFIPVGWWHHVRALDVSMTVSFTNFQFPNSFKWE
jgi:LPS sulfotransferase NodH